MISTQNLNIISFPPCKKGYGLVSVRSQPYHTRWDLLKNIYLSIYLFIIIFFKVFFSKKNIYLFIIFFNYYLKKFLFYFILLLLLLFEKKIDKKIRMGIKHLLGY